MRVDKVRGSFDNWVDFEVTDTKVLKPTSRYIFQVLPFIGKCLAAKAV